MSRSHDVTVDLNLDLTSNTECTYKVLEKLGRKGGSGSAFLVICTDGPNVGLPFAAKFFLNPKSTRRKGFLKEAEYLRNHPHQAVLPVYDSGTSLQEYPFYISRYMATNLEEVIKAGETSMLDKLLYSSQLASALEYLASANPQILHRDIKASNVFVNGRTCVLGDFGMMQRLGLATVDKEMPWEARTPDLVRYLNGGEVPTPQSDVFSLGVVLYRLFTGKQAL